jgi:hypothetical protein
MSKDIDEQILRCTSNYEASKMSPLFFEIIVNMFIFQI